MAGSVEELRPVLAVSACLGFEACRYDGQRLADPLPPGLAAGALLVPFCPEAALGLGVPRPPIRLVQHGDGTRLVQPDTGRELTAAMRALAEAFLAGNPDLDGCVLKTRSPSCAPADARLYGAAAREEVRALVPGAFARVLLERGVPAAGETDLADPDRCELFLARVAALARQRAAARAGRLRAFHGRLRPFLAAWGGNGGGALAAAARGDGRDHRRLLARRLAQAPAPAAGRRHLARLAPRLAARLAPADRRSFAALVRQVEGGAPFWRPLRFAAARLPELAERSPLLYRPFPPAWRSLPT